MSHSKHTSNLENRGADSIQSAYNISGRELNLSSSNEIKEALLKHITQINPDLAREMQMRPTDESVVAVVRRVNEIADSKAANDALYGNSATGNFLQTA